MILLPDITSNVTCCLEGSPHVHILIWIRDAPDVTRLEQMSPEELEETVRFFEDKICAWNYGKGLAPAVIHPCRRRLCEIPPAERERALGELLNKVQRHARQCPNDYCRRRNKRTGRDECRFGFPIPEREDSDIIRNLKGHLEFTPKRNDGLINLFCILIIIMWRANMDLRAVTSKQAMSNYLAKYASKPEKKSKPMMELFEDALRGLEDQDDAKKAVMRRLIQSISDRDYSSQVRSR